MAIIIRRGDLQDAEAFTCFLKEVRETMGNKEWFFLDPPEVVRECLRDGSMQLWLAMDGNRIAAAFDILIPGLASFNYGYDLNLSTQELGKVVHMDTAAVHPDYRGLGLQNKMIQIAESELAGKGKRILLCTVHPDNSFSLRNVLKRGYAIQKKLEKYNSVRYILRKDIF